MNAEELYRAGRLAEAIEAMNDEVRKNPADPARRSFLCDLLCIAGAFERADVQLEAISKLLPGAEVAISLVRQLIRAEQWRQHCFVEGRLPAFLDDPSDRLKLHLEALLHLREGDPAKANELLAHAEEERCALRGSWGEVTFDDFRDCDDVTASFFEILTSTGKYYWIPMERVERIEFREPERPRDLCWRRVLMEVSDGPDGEVFLPTVYAPVSQETDELVRLGRKTEWSEEEPVRGIGLRTFLAGEEALSILTPGELVLQPVAG